MSAFTRSSSRVSSAYPARSGAEVSSVFSAEVIVPAGEKSVIFPDEKELAPGRNIIS